ncbi:MAG: hypothetical protein A3I07_04035 [Candidatus Doudnabacteria bacterium RIFCSPLOWO2_02_FULL_42_9]|uniref:tRNA-dihydrouridine synthase n=1 Tax=Candidatus Doudnabacteria bacterium RIFCSPHIGHO2_01_FULL_41_86 TaxID=1817821 RepID=A0A1F5NA79_9BACT|nr:MAG: hypothetical protein A2717_02620 [Candidatus Doudnabacteria bacterium RIFCSPHIGHO2_01_FULL_41_86]OGE75529.1 MAG: hypothetical protein A3K07_00950 [Candidatus Doudnabacteria bacterium RIFCSPHIGHO2_01_43_10]OGE85517.1 MAG: hypothetical protein A3E28_02190 [Candidatus Doudnabacteria bacterium RIFCSPHIGHO2_12_FULL_42_22]OGE87055.1 MAG: hypothetical protein A3C49_03025 [Candidatus Doudnabacteria bacterium RIFCSPHIGHO2_02_FULL_42_25]OGE92653.1 MAG: hypothetical protein A2895_03180 [Candidatus
MVLAPLADVTDAAFRELIAKYGKPDVFWTEFVSVDGLNSEGLSRLLVDFWYGENEHPIVAQIFGSNPENFYKAAKLIKELGFDGVDINMGCPVKKILNQKACSALIKTPALAQEIIHATKEGAGELPVSVKTRIGFNKIEIDTWLPTILKTEISVLTVHLRTVKEMSKVPAHWEVMRQITDIRDQISKETLILGNGDVANLAEAEQKVAETGCDGIMIGRGIFGNPWLFSRKPQISLSERLKVMIEHTKLFEQKFAGIKSFETMKKHYKAYVNGFDGAKELRVKLMETQNAKEVEEIVESAIITSAINKNI